MSFARHAGGKNGGFKKLKMTQRDIIKYRNLCRKNHLDHCGRKDCIAMEHSPMEGLECQVCNLPMRGNPYIDESGEYFCLECFHSLRENNDLQGSQK